MEQALYFFAIMKIDCGFTGFYAKTMDLIMLSGYLR